MTFYGTPPADADSIKASVTAAMEPQLRAQVLAKPPDRERCGPVTTT